MQGFAWAPDKPDMRFFVDVVDASGNAIRSSATRPVSPEVAQADLPADCGFDVRLPPGGGELRVVVAETNETVSAPEPETSMGDWLRKAYKKIRRARTQKATCFPDLPCVLDEPACIGAIADIEGGRIDVWLDSRAASAIPMVFVNNKPAWQSPETIHNAGQPESATGYRFYISGIARGAQISLWAIVGTQVVLCEVRRTGNMSFERSVMAQLGRAAEIAKQPDAVAITCWDGGHNPVGRAKVLYDVVQTRRPVVMFCFLFPDFGGDIWPPLANQDLNIVTIPWQDRFLYLNMAQSMGLTFDTIWMCKPRMPTFHMAAHLCHDKTRVILDLDDNEEHFSRSKASRFKAYGLPSIGSSKALMEGVPARTAASASLQQDFDTTLVRHVREDAVRDQPQPGDVIKVGFIGTVRPHKRIDRAAEAIRQAVEATGQKYEFHVYGDVQPESLVRDLTRQGVVFKQNVPLNQLQDHLRSLDIILSGFPSSEEKDEPITRYQISAKIGDALSVGRPILVPAGPSVADLEGTDGVHLFSLDTFEEALTRAAASLGKVRVSLPESFTLEYGYQQFLKAEQKAEASARGNVALRFMPTGAPPPAARPSLLLIWKQHDGGLYGRRMDMVCRAYRAAYPGHRIVVLEILFRDFDDRYRNSQSGLSESAFIREMNPRKLVGVLNNKDDIEYHQIFPMRSDQLNRDMLEYLASNDLQPNNTVIILYPNILHLDRIYDLLEPYRIITDVVDNQLAWASGHSKLNVSRQYYALTRMSDRILFNSAVNRDYFIENGFLDGAMNRVALIPNWYSLPADFDPAAQPPRDDTHFDIVYSGNMNDRIDWDLMTRIARIDPGVRLHLVGEAGRSQEEMSQLLEEPNVIYHGVQSEHRTLQLLSQADLTVMPHVTDQVSAYMNPLKVHMYAALGLNTIASDIPGIKASGKLVIAPSPEDFIRLVSERVARHREQPAQSPASAQDHELLDGSEYVSQIASLRET